MSGQNGPGGKMQRTFKALTGANDMKTVYGYGLQ